MVTFLWKMLVEWFSQPKMVVHAASWQGSF
jgi:hypothetical protein